MSGASVTPTSIWRWFDDRAHWHGTNGIPTRLHEHVSVCAVSLLIAVLIAWPIAIVLGHARRGGVFAQNIANLGRAVPSLAILIVAVPLVGIGARPAEIALIALAVPPLMTNAYVGMAAVDDDIREAARGAGMTAWQSIVHAELPIALPLMLAGLRTATFQVIATATLAAVVASGGLGQYITEGIGLRDNVELVCGSLLVVGLAVCAEVVLAAIQRAVVAPPLRSSVRSTTANRTEEPSHALAP